MSGNSQRLKKPNNFRNSDEQDDIPSDTLTSVDVVQENFDFSWIFKSTNIKVLHWAVNQHPYFLDMKPQNQSAHKSVSKRKTVRKIVDNFVQIVERIEEIQPLKTHRKGKIEKCYHENIIIGRQRPHSKALWHSPTPIEYFNSLIQVLLVLK